MDSLKLELRFLQSDLKRLLIFMIPIFVIIAFTIQYLLNNANFATFTAILKTRTTTDFLFFVASTFGFFFFYQLIWKDYQISLQQIILTKQRRTTLFWRNKVIISLSMTLIYVLLIFLLLLMMVFIHSIPIGSLSLLFIEFLLFFINFSWHFMLWIFIKIQFSSMLSNILLLILLIQSAYNPIDYMPLYFAQIQHYTPTQITFILLIEIVLIITFYLLIQRKGKLIDYLEEEVD